MISLPGLSKRILQTLSLENCNKTATPASTIPLGSFPDSPAHDPELWNYASVIGMLLYLAGNTRPDLSYAVHQAARFSHDPKKEHGEAVKRIGRYIKGTTDEGIHLKAGSKLTMDAYADASFAGLWNVENAEDPISVKSRTGYVITLAGCPLTWKSKLQSLIAVSTMEAEYIALSHCMRELIPLRRLLKEVGKVFNVSEGDLVMHSVVFEDNTGALQLAKVPKMTPRSKHIALRYHYFRKEVVDGNIKIEHISTKLQKADIFTKGLGDVKFRELRKLLLGW